MGSQPHAVSATGMNPLNYNVLTAGAFSYAKATHLASPLEAIVAAQCCSGGGTSTAVVLSLGSELYWVTNTRISTNTIAVYSGSSASNKQPFHQIHWIQ